MTAYVLPLAATVLAAALVYVCCVRPMLRHHRRNSGDLDAQIADARTELAHLRSRARGGGQSAG